MLCLISQTNFKTRKTEPHWYWWNAINWKASNAAKGLSLPLAHPQTLTDDTTAMSFMAMYRLSPRFIDKLVSNLGLVSGYGEAYLPTLALSQNWKCEAVHTSFVGVDPDYVDKPLYLTQWIQRCKESRYPSVGIIKMMDHWSDEERLKMERQLWSGYAAAAAVSRDESSVPLGHLPMLSASVPGKPATKDTLTKTATPNSWWQDRPADVFVPESIKKELYEQPSFRWSSSSVDAWFAERWLGAKFASEKRLLILELNPRKEERNMFLKRRMYGNLIESYRLEDPTVQLENWYAMLQPKPQKFDMVRIAHLEAKAVEPIVTSSIVKQADILILKDCTLPSATLQSDGWTDVYVLNHDKQRVETIDVSLPEWRTARKDYCVTRVPLHLWLDAKLLFPADK